MRYRNSRQVTGVVKMSLSASPAVSGTSVFRQKGSIHSGSPFSINGRAGCWRGKLATLSDGTVFEPVNSFQKNRRRWRDFSDS